MSKERFDSPKGFILSSVGAAVGLGNAVRFPGLCAKYGGGTFIAVYLIALIVLGLPLLNAEIALGRKSGGGAPECMESLKKRGSYLGWASSANSLLVAVIYAGLIGWIFAAAIKIIPLSFSDKDPENYFFGEVLKSRGDGVISGISPLVSVCIVLVWLIIFFCLKGGVGRLAGAAKYCVYFPVACLSALAVRGLFYERSGEALAALFLPDFSALLSPELWFCALSQVFFSLSIAVGIMPAFGACLPPRTNAFVCSLIIAAADFFVSVLSSVVMFTTLYGCGLVGNLTATGVNAAFAVYPVALTRIFGSHRALNAAAGFLFYLSLALMAVQSAASMAQSFLSPLASALKVKKEVLAAVICGVCCCFCLVYATTGAPAFVDIGDKFCNSFSVLALAFAECLLLGYGKGGGDLCERINEYTGRLRCPERLYFAAVRFICPAILLALTLWGSVYIFSGGLHGYSGGAVVVFGVLPTAAAALSGFAVRALSSALALRRTRPKKSLRGKTEIKKRRL